MKSSLQIFLKEFNRIDVAILYAMFDIKTRFKASLIGPFWLTLHTLIFTLTLGFIFSIVFNTNISEYLPYLSAGLMVWTFMSTQILESTNLFNENSVFIRNVSLPISTYIFRVIIRNLVIVLFHFPITLFVLIYFGKATQADWLLFLVNSCVLIIIISNLTCTISIISARFTDMQPIVQAILQVIFLITPILWSTDTMSERTVFFEFNPIYHLLEFIRAPLLGKAVTDQTVFAIMILFTITSVTAWYFYFKYSSRVVYWIK